MLDPIRGESLPTRACDNEPDFHRDPESRGGF